MSRESFANSGRSETQAVADLAAALGEMRFQMRNLARNSILSDVDKYLPEQLAGLQNLVAECRGLVVAGGIDTSEYFLPSRDEGEVFAKAKLPFHKHSTNNFSGVLRGIDQIPVPTFRGSVQRLCLALDPLYTSGNEVVGAYLANRGCHLELRHPFGVAEHADERVWVAVDSINETSFGVPDLSDN